MEKVWNIESLVQRSHRAIETSICKFLGPGLKHGELLQIARESVQRTISANYIVEDTFDAFKNLIRNNLEKSLERFAKRKTPRSYETCSIQYKACKKYPRGYWRKDNGRAEAIKELKTILSFSGYSPKAFPLIVNAQFIIDHGLRIPLNIFFHGSPFAFLDAAFPGKYMPWQMEITPKGYFDSDEKIIQATRWLVETVLKFDVSNMDPYTIWKYQIGRKITEDAFNENGLRGLMQRFNGQPAKIIRFVYPGKFQDWDLSDHHKWSRGMQSLGLAARATRWVIEEYAKLTPNSPHINAHFFIANGLGGMLTSKKLGLNGSPKAVLKNAYPEREFT